MFDRSWTNPTYSKPHLAWDPKDVPGSLQNVNTYAEDLAQFNLNWYYNKKAHKARFSRFFRYGAIFSTSLAGLLPVIIGTWPNLLTSVVAAGNDKLLVSLAVGLAAVLIALDRFAGYSTAWIRYIRSAAEINRLLHEYRLDWITSISEAHGESTQAGNMLARTRQFVTAIQGVVIQETQAWATEFESSLSDMEKSAREQSEKQVKELQAKLDSTQPGSLFVAVTNITDLEGRKYKLALFSNREKLVEAPDQTGVWERLALVPGIYTVQLTASIAGEPVSKIIGITVEPGKPKHESVALAKVKAAGT